MSLHMKAIILLAIAPFLAFWGWQIGLSTGAVLTGTDEQVFILFPTHFGWYVAALGLISLNLLVVSIVMGLNWLLTSDCKNRGSTEIGIREMESENV